MLKKVVFVDRDGVINRDSPEYIKSTEEFEFLPRSIEAIRDLHSAGFTVIVITNQSAINRKLAPLEEIERIHTHMRESIRNGKGKIKGIFFCPHHPSENCSCRKPKPGLIHQAQRRYRIDLSDAVLVGDSAKDIECAGNAGCGTAILVRTGNGREAEKVLAQKNVSPDHIAQDFYHAAQWILSRQ